MKDELYLIDLTNLIYRFFFAFIRNPLRNREGFNTSAIFGIASFIRELKTGQGARYACAMYDLRDKTFRHDDYAQYKSGRPDTPEELIEQIPHIMSLTEAMGIKTVGISGYEADDLIGTFARKFRDDFSRIIIVTSDKDMGQLVDEKTFIMFPKKENGVYPLLDTAAVEKKLDIRKEQIIDYFSLTGDAVDSVPGVAGIGPKTAVKILREVGSMEQFFKDVSLLKNTKLREKLIENRENIELYRKLVTIKTDIEIDLTDDDLVIADENVEALNTIAGKFDIFSLLQQTSKEECRAAESDMKGVAESNGPIFMRMDSAGRVLAVSEDCFSVSADLSVLELFRDRDIITENLKRDWDMSSLCSLNRVYDLSLIRQMDSRNPSIEKVFQESGKDLPDLENYQDFAESMSSIIRKVAEDIFKSRNLEVYRRIELPILPIIVSMENAGIETDREFFLKERKMLSERIKEKESDIFNLAGEKFNLNSPKQISGILFNKLGIKPLKSMKTGFSTGYEVLLELSATYPIASEILYFREMNKLLTGFVEPILQNADSEGIIRTTFEQTYAATGRFASRNPNLQNIPPDIRKGFIPRGREWVFMSADYSQIELRVLAHISGDKNLLKAFEEGQDIHSITAMSIFSVDEKSVTARMRSIAKVINFSILYGKTAYGLSKELGISRKDASEFIEKYFALYSRVREWIDEVIEETRKNLCTETIFGRVREITEINSANRNVREASERVAVNAPIQGSAADIMKIAMKKVYEEVKGKDDIKMLLTIHDELLFEVKENAAEKYRSVIEKSMTDIEPLNYILKVNIKTGKNWYECK